MGLTDLNLADSMDEGAWMHVVHPRDRTPLYADDEQKKPVRIKLLGKDSDTYLAADRAARAKTVENMSKQAPWSAAEQDHRTAIAFAKCTAGWENVPLGWVDGTKSEDPVKCTEDHALKLYENRGLKWLREQVDDFIGGRAAFLKA